MEREAHPQFLAGIEVERALVAKNPIHVDVAKVRWRQWRKRRQHRLAKLACRCTPSLFPPRALSFSLRVLLNRMVQHGTRHDAGL